MLNQLVNKLKKDKTNWINFQDQLVEREVTSKTILLKREKYQTMSIILKRVV